MANVDKNAAREAAKVGAKGDLANEFMRFAYFAYGLNFATETGILVHPIELPEGKVKIAIVILEDTTIKQIEKSWWELDIWRNALTEWQGTPPDETNNFYETMSKAQTEGVSYNQLAKQINQRIRELLQNMLHGWMTLLNTKSNLENIICTYGFANIWKSHNIIALRLSSLLMICYVIADRS